MSAGVRQNANDQPYTIALPTPRPLGESLDASFFAKSVKYPVPRLAHPARKVVFTFRSQDQGWASDRGDPQTPYAKSWTWFEAGLERFDASCVGKCTQRWWRIYREGYELTITHRQWIYTLSQLAPASLSPCSSDVRRSSRLQLRFPTAALARMGDSTE